MIDDTGMNEPSGPVFMVKSELIDHPSSPDPLIIGGPGQGKTAAAKALTEAVFRTGYASTVWDPGGGDRAVFRTPDGDTNRDSEK